MSKVIVRNGNVDNALKTFKQRNVKDGLLKEVRKREHYSKPGEKRRIAKKEGIKNSRRRERNYN
ncbi:MAG: 30S ribosomal protein S21 [Candidatus Faecisoma sp.]|jgi:small subunit ribosomal protein S21|nr:30S ribosomal protein S21 [Acholeplasma sp.]MCI5678203.1 30S ribosomal protein S21 [Acholeplasma sp.]MDY2892453.1 30S ribosomal protein S21 [Candidatus Faecisoma sp.]CCY28332.1 sSU ribosomal protein S21P [Acholeplasma sp. CAG:878]